jgi:hypothetical protein
MRAHAAVDRSHLVVMAINAGAASHLSPPNWETIALLLGLGSRLEGGFGVAAPETVSG